MVHPVLEEILRAKLPIRPDVLIRWQRLIQHEVIPSLTAESEPAKPAKATPKEAA